MSAPAEEAAAAAAVAAAVAAVVVTYHPDALLGEALAATLPQVGRVIVVDNGSTPAELAAVPELNRAELIRNPGNLGLAAAQNQGIRRALELGFRWVLLLDQDSVPDPGMVAALVDAARGDAGIGIAAAVPYDACQAGDTRFLVSPDGRERRVATAAEPVLRGLLFAIASGSLMPAAVLERVGLMREEFFIDYVDIEFSLRVRRAGYEVVAVRDARLRHRLGAYEERRLFGRVVPVTHHSAARRYTQCRNRLRTLRLHGRAFPVLLRSELPAMAADLLRVLLFERGRVAKLWAMARGAARGLLERPKD